jgi:N-alpha-acetyltransferase 35, NatC auxiliary subunit
MHLDIFQDSDQFLALISATREQLSIIRAHPSPSPAPDSPPWLAFDPAIARRLNSFAPLRIVEPRTPEMTWDSIHTLLNGLEELHLLSKTTRLSTWEVTYY